MQDEMEEIIIEFITEAEESLDKIEPLFVELERKGEDKDMLNDIFRSMHTIKGAAGFLGFQLIVDVAHASENIMKKVRDGEIAMSRLLMDVLLRSVDMLRLLLRHLKEKDGVTENVSPLVKDLGNALAAAVSKTPETGHHEKTAGEAKLPESAAPVIEKPEIPVMKEVDLTQAHAANGEQHTVAASAPPKQKETLTAALSGEHNQAPEKTAPANGAVKPDTQPQATDDGEPKQEPKQNEMIQSAKDNIQKAQNLRVDVHRIDKVMDLAGEVVLVRNRLLNISNYFDFKYTGDPMTEVLMETVSFLDRVTSDMQLAVMKMRMQPIQKVLSKFPRLVRDISASVKKDVDLQIFGEGTEVDKSVIEHIGDPMTHILRNSIDHGLESSEERIAKGKPQQGKIVINTYQKGNQIVIEIADDGKGMDVNKLKSKAVEKGLMTEDEAQKMSDEAAVDIIFMPGFSTKEVATELSGRGVGMDVVKTNISLLNGYVEVSTVKDVGTTFKICIPLTLAIIQALMVEVDGAKYAIPLSPIEETLKVSRKEIDNITGQSVIVVRDKICPLFELNDLLNTGTTGSSNEDYKYLIVISMGDKRFCIAVDKLLGQEEVVIKTLAGLDTTSSNVLGATITGDGKVVFILDVAGMSRNLLGITKG
ncbi:MAG: chemotaxis protein CheA [Nitrospiraceae bacterium]|nr:MAG: chemotaxis protein CheA [Nitrospiraceae bacterium]